MYLGIDIGGTKTLLARFTKDGGLQETLKFPTPKEFNEFKKELAINIAKITTKPWTMAAVAGPGKINHKKGEVEAFGNLRWINTPLVATVKAIANCDVLLENDAKLAGLSEARLLKPTPHKVLYVTVSTGIGAAIVIDGVLSQDLIDAEVGKMPHERDGKIVTWESFAAGSAIVRRFGKMASEINDPLIWKIISRDIAIGLIDVCSVVQPNIIIIGGGVGSHFNKYKVQLREALKEYESTLIKAPKIVGAKKPEQAVIYGCYQLMKDAMRAAAKAKIRSKD
jgi:predicted NBD/HSP70 family sugar kinase